MGEKQRMAAVKEAFAFVLQLTKTPAPAASPEAEHWIGLESPAKAEIRDGQLRLGASRWIACVGIERRDGCL